MTARQRFVSAGTVVAMGALLFGASTAFAGNDTLRDLTAEQASVASFGEERASMSNIKVSAWVDRRNATYRVGEQVTLRVKANKAVYITVLDVGTSGKAHVVFPNAYQTENRVPAYQVVRIPDENSSFKLTVGGPSGREVLKVIATEYPIKSLEIRSMEKSGPYYSAGQASAIVRDLTAEFDDKQKVDYGVATLILNIE